MGTTPATGVWFCGGRLPEIQVLPRTAYSCLLKVRWCEKLGEQNLEFKLRNIEILNDLAANACVGRGPFG